VWSPSGAGYEPQGEGKNRIFALIDGAESTLDVYALLVDFLPFQNRLIGAAKRGVKVRAVVIGVIVTAGVLLLQVYALISSFG